MCEGQYVCVCPRECVCVYGDDSRSSTQYRRATHTGHTGHTGHTRATYWPHTYTQPHGSHTRAHTHTETRPHTHTRKHTHTHTHTHARIQAREFAEKRYLSSDVKLDLCVRDMRPAHTKTSLYMATHVRSYPSTNTHIRVSRVGLSREARVDSSPGESSRDDHTR